MDATYAVIHGADNNIWGNTEVIGDGLHRHTIANVGVVHEWYVDGVEFYFNSRWDRLDVDDFIVAYCTLEFSNYNIRPAYSNGLFFHVGKKKCW